MEDHGIRMMAEVFGGKIIMIMFGLLVRPLGKGVPMIYMLIWIMMEYVFQKYPIKNGNYGMVLIGMMLEAMSKSDVAINQKVNRH